MSQGLANKRQRKEKQNPLLFVTTAAVTRSRIIDQNYYNHNTKHKTKQIKTNKE
jgi:hypothetical protein